MPATDAYYTIATNRLAFQMQQIDQLDAKVATVFRAASVMLAVFVGVLTIAVFPVHVVEKGVDILLVCLNVMVVYAVLAFNLYKAYHVGDWSVRPDLITFQTNCANYEENVMKEWVANECITSLQHNKPHIEQKSRWMDRSFKLLALETVLIAITGVLVVFAK